MAANDKKPTDNAPIVLGPFNIGKWFLKSYADEERLGDPSVESLTSPKCVDVAKLLADCRLYLLDRREDMPGKGIRFADDKPIAMIEGKMAGKWKEDGKAYALYVADLSIGGVDTVYNKGLSYRSTGGITVKIHLYGSDGKNTSEAVFAFTSDRPAVKYDINGQILRD